MVNQEGKSQEFCWEQGQIWMTDFLQTKSRQD